MALTDKICVYKCFRFSFVTRNHRAIKYTWSARFDCRVATIGRSIPDAGRRSCQLLTPLTFYLINIDTLLCDSKILRDFKLTNNYKLEKLWRIISSSKKSHKTRIVVMKLWTRIDTNFIPRKLPLLLHLTLSHLCYLTSIKFVR